MRKLNWLLLPVAWMFFGCSQNNVTEDASLGKYFDSAGVRGCFGLFDNAQGHFTIYNLPRYRDSSYRAGGTFNILASLVALQTGVLTNDSSEVYRAYSTFGGSQKVGFRDVFQSDSGDMGLCELVRKIAKDTLKKWVDSLKYGNMDIDKADSGHSCLSHLKITPDEQLGLIKKLYFNQLPFFEHVQESMKKMMPQESNANTKFYYKLAGDVTPDGHMMEWDLGWVEENKHIYFYVVNLETKDANKSLAGKELKVTKDILRGMGFFQGKK
jgi:beta-lactamase class D